VLGLRILEGVVDDIILTRVLCNTNVGVLYKDSKRVFKGLIAIIECYITACVSKENLRIKVSGLSCVSIFMNNDLVHFILNAFKGKPRLSLELNKIQFYAGKV
jgi:hypothetical protein